MTRPFAKRGKGETPRQEDVFIEKILQAVSWAQENLRVVIAAAVILGLGAASILYYRSYRATVHEQAAVELQTLGAELGTVPPAAAGERLEELVSRYEGTAAADEARLLLARVQLDAGRPADAIETLQPVTRQPADIPLGYAARSLLATAHEANGEPERALELYAGLAADARLAFQRRRALAERARLLAQQGNFTEAATLYEDLARRAEAADAPEEAALYRLRGGEARASAGTPESEATPAGGGASSPPDGALTGGG